MKKKPSQKKQSKLSESKRKEDIVKFSKSQFVKIKKLDLIDFLGIIFFTFVLLTFSLSIIFLVLVLFSSKAKKEENTYKITKVPESYIEAPVPDSYVEYIQDSPEDPNKKGQIKYKAKKIDTEYELIILSSKKELELLNTKTGEIKQLTFTGGHVKDFILGKDHLIFTIFTDNYLEATDRVPTLGTLRSPELVDGVYSIYTSGNNDYYPIELFRPAKFVTNSDPTIDLKIIPEMRLKTVSLLTFIDDNTFLYQQANSIKSFDISTNITRDLYTMGSSDFCSYNFSAFKQDDFLFLSIDCYEGFVTYVLKFNKSGNLENYYPKKVYYNHYFTTYLPIGLLGREVIFSDFSQVPQSLSEEKAQTMEILYFGEKIDKKELTNLTNKFDVSYFRRVNSLTSESLYLFSCDLQRGALIGISKEKKLSEIAKFEHINNSCSMLDSIETTDGEFLILTSNFQSGVGTPVLNLQLLSTIDDSYKTILEITSPADNQLYLRKVQLMQ